MTVIYLQHFFICSHFFKYLIDFNRKIKRNMMTNILIIFIYYSPKKKSKPAPKRTSKAAKSAADRGQEPVNAQTWLYSDEEEEPAHAPPPTGNVSVYSRRVAGGSVRRKATLSGDLLAELRIYNPEEVKNLEGYERCDKAVVWMRYQGNSSSPELVALKKFVKIAKTKFTEEGTFFNTKKNK